MRLSDWRLRASFAVLALAAACSEGQQAPPSGPPPGAMKVDDSKTGTLAGRVLFEGSAPESKPIKMASDPVCLRAHPDGRAFETFVVDKGGLENVFVYVKDGLGNYYFDVPAEAVKLDQKGCLYYPHVFGARVGQPIEIQNSDQTLHNVHALPTVNREFNFAQSLAGIKNIKTFTTPEVMIPFKCDVHGWMNAYAGVLTHPYFAVTANGGRFELKNVPAGTYTIEAWHEKAGAQTQNVTLGEKDSKDITFTFKAPAGTN
jgi:plastocyanin